MEILDNILHKILIASILYYLFKIVLGKHAWNLSTTKKIIDIFQEGFIDHMILRENEAYLLVFKCSQLHYPKDILSELVPTIVLSDLDLFNLALTNYSSQIYHWFLTRTTQPHQQNMSFIELQSPSYPHHMRNRIWKQDKAHISLISHVIWNNLDEFSIIFWLFIYNIFFLEAFSKEITKVDRGLKQILLS